MYADWNEQVDMRIMNDVAGERGENGYDFNCYRIPKSQIAQWREISLG